MTVALIAPFAGPAQLDTVGGKGLNLSRLFRAGLPVPPGFTVTTAAYRDFVRRQGLQTVIAAALNGAGTEGAFSVDAASEVIRAGFAAGEIPEETAAAILDAYAAMGRPPVAVRSSATAEDLPGLSFAGQQETVLNVVDDAALLAAVVRCWSSLWTPRAITYRTRNAIDQESVTLAVVVQSMVDAEASGVLFTANPLTGKRDEVVIDATLGLGEALVSGQVEPDHYVVDPSGRITLKAIGAKALTIRSSGGGGTVSLQQDAADRQALPDASIVDLARLSREVGKVVEGPQDIEWAFADGRLYLLQARPITTLYPLPDGMSAEPLRAMFSFGSVQGMLDPITPLGRDAITAALIGAGKVFGSHATAETQSLLWTAGERLWIDVSGLMGSRRGTQACARSAQIRRSGGAGGTPGPRRPGQVPITRRAPPAHCVSHRQSTRPDARDRTDYAASARGRTTPAGYLSGQDGRGVPGAAGTDGDAGGTAARGPGPHLWSLPLRPASLRAAFRSGNGRVQPVDASCRNPARGHL